MFNKIKSLPRKAGGEINKIIAELRLVDWISRQNAVKSTTLVIFATIIIVLALIAVDALLLNIRGVLFSRPF